MKLPKTAESDSKPKSFKETIFTSTPVVLTVLATILAGLSSGELTRSQYYRSMASQRQSKASDQWGYYQAKRSRAVEAEDALDQLAAAGRPAALDLDQVAAASGSLAALDPAAGKLNGQLPKKIDIEETIAPYASVAGKPPAATDQPVGDADVRQAVADVNLDLTEQQMAPLLRRLTDDQVTDALETNANNLKAYDQTLNQPSAALDKLHAIFAGETEIADGLARREADKANVARDVAAAAADIDAAYLRLAVVRYNSEAAYNAVTGNLYEVMVRQSGVFSDRHRARSNRFFYGMLIAQMGVTVSTLSLAVRRRSVFWSLAAISGAAAVGFSGYIYIYT